MDDRPSYSSPEENVQIQVVKRVRGSGKICIPPNFSTGGVGALMFSFRNRHPLQSYSVTRRPHDFLHACCTCLLL